MWSVFQKDSKARVLYDVLLRMCGSAVPTQPGDWIRKNVSKSCFMDLKQRFSGNRFVSRL